MNVFRKVVSIFCCFSVVQQALAASYVIKRGDTLSGIAHRNFSGKVYGKNGSLNKLLGLNPNLTDPDLIYPGQMLNLSKDEVILSHADASKVKIEDSMKQKSDPQNGALSPDEKSRTFAQFQDNQQTASEANADEYSSFQITAGIGQSRLDSTDSSTNAKSVLGSTFSPQVDAKWTQNWASGLRTFLGAGIKKESFQTTSSTHTLSGENPVLTNFQIGAGLWSTPSFNLDLSLGLESFSFVRATSSTQLTLDRVSTPVVGAEFSYKFLQSRVFSLSAVAAAKYLMGSSQSSYDVNSGYGYDLGLILEHAGENRKNPFFGGLVFSSVNQNTSISTQNYKSAALVFGFRFDIGKDNDLGKYNDVDKNKAEATNGLQ